MAAADGRFNRTRQVAPICPPIWARWHHLANMVNLCFLRPSRFHNPNGKSIGSALSAQLMAESLYSLQWTTLSPKISPSHGGSGPHLIDDSSVRAHNPNGITIGSAVFTHVTAECPCTLQWASLSPKIAPSHGEIWTPI